jgi:Na+/proline symporter
MGMGAGIVDHPSTALFAVLENATPSWLILMVLVLAVALVMSSMDSLLNGLVSSFTSDLHRIKPTVKTSNLLSWARLLTIVLAAIAVIIATQGYSVLYMFLIADLVAVAVVVPVFAGLYFVRHQGWIAILGGLFGIIAGSLFFPKSDFTAWLNIPMAGNLMASFLVALLSSSLIVFFLIIIASFRRWGSAFDFQKLQESVHSFTE